MERTEYLDVIVDTFLSDAVFCRDLEFIPEQASEQTLFSRLCTPAELSDDSLTHGYDDQLPAAYSWPY